MSHYNDTLAASSVYLGADAYSAISSGASAAGDIFSSYFKSQEADAAAKAAGYTSDAAKTIAETNALAAETNALAAATKSHDMTQTILIIGGVGISLLVVGALVWPHSRR